MFLTASLLDLCSRSEHFCSSNPGSFLSRNQLFSDFKVKAEDIWVVGANCLYICRCRWRAFYPYLWFFNFFFFNSRTQDIIDFQVHCQSVQLPFLCGVGLKVDWCLSFGNVYYFTLCQLFIALQSYSCCICTQTISQKKELIPSTSAEISLFSVKVHVFDVLAKWQFESLIFSQDKKSVDNGRAYVSYLSSQYVSSHI